MAAMIELQHYFVCLIILAFISRFLFRSLSNKTSQRVLKLPPSPPSLPVIGHLHHLVGAPLHQSFHNLSTKYGPIVYIKFGVSRKLLISSASLAAEVFKKNDLAFASRPAFSVEERLPHVASSFLNSQYGEYWRFMKKLCVTKLLGPQALEASRGVRREELCNFLHKMLDSAVRMKTMDVGFELLKLSNNTICRMVMSTRCSGEENEAEKCRKLVQETFEYAVKLSIGEILGPFKWFGFWLFGKQAMDVGRRFDELTEKIWKEHENRRERRSRRSKGDNEPKDLMDILLDVYYDNNAEYRLTRTQVKAFLQEIFIAGTETTSNTIQWALAELINHPDVLKKVMEEIDSIVGNSRLVEEPDIPSLPYLQAVIQEVLRLHPVGSIVPRESREDCQLNGFDVPAKTSVIINLYAIMRDSNVWDDPDEFKPERFLASALDEEVENGSRSSNFFSFGGGRRRCPGMMLAYISVYSTVAAIVQCFDLRAYHQNGKEGKIVDMQPARAMNHGMAHPLVCLPVVRFNPFAT